MGAAQAACACARALTAPAAGTLLRVQCSGSGIVSRKDWLVEDEDAAADVDESRLAALVGCGACARARARRPGWS